MLRKLVLLLAVYSLTIKAQCPQVYNYLNVLSPKPYWISCSGSTVYPITFQSNTSWGSYTLSWGDGTPNQVAASYTANTSIPHTYTSNVADTFVVTLTIPANNCTMVGVVVMEQSVTASVQLPPGGSGTGCAPAALQFSNASTNVSKTTKFTWNFGDGTPPVQLTYTNGAYPLITHTYAPGSVNCQTAVTLSAYNYCSMGNTTTSTYSPINIFSKDTPSITPDKFITCWPSNSFTFTNNSGQNCAGQGNTFQRKEQWNFGKYWGNPLDSLYPWSNWPPSTPRTISFPSVGSYSIMLQDSNFCGVSQTILNVSILNPPTASVVAPAGPFCQASNITFTNASSPGYVYMWDFGVGAGFVNLGPGNKTFAYPNPGTYTVQLAAFLPGGGAPCSSTANVVVSIFSGAVADFSFSPALGCGSLSNVNFTNTSQNATTWSWDFGNGNSSNLQNPPAQNYTTTGVYTLSLTVTGTNACVHTKTTSLEVHPNPTVAFNPTTSCVNQVTTFTNLSTVTGTNPINSYTWDLGNGAPNLFTQNPAYTYTTPGFYNVTLTVSTAFCSASLTQTLFVTPSPLASFVFSPSAACNPFNVTFTNTSQAGISYTWNFGTVPTQSTAVFEPAFTYTNGGVTPLGYTVTLYVANAFGCISTATDVVTVLPVPVPSFTASPLSGCAPLAVSFTNNSVGADTYSWTFGDGNGSAQTNPTNTYTNGSGSPQTLTVTMVASSSLGCSASSTLPITVLPQSFFTIAMTPSVGCTPLSVSFSTVNGASSYTWNFGDGSPVSTSSNPTHVFTNTTAVDQTYTVSLIASNVFGCIDTSYAFPTIFAKPAADFTASPVSGCSPLAVNFTNTSVGSTSVFWDFNNGLTSSNTDPSTTYTNSPGAPSTTFTVLLIAVNANNCRDSITRNITLFPRPQASFALDTPACSPKLVSFTNTSTGAGSYSWNLGNGSTSTQTNASSTYTAGALGNTQYTVTLVATSANGCVDSVQVPFYVHPDVNFSISAVPDNGCANLSVSFPAIPGVSQYQWTWGDGSVSGGGNIGHVFANTGTSTVVYTVQLIARDVYGCRDTSRRIITVYPKPQAMFSADPSSVFTSQQVNFTNQSTAAATYSWSFGDGKGSVETSPAHTYTNGGEYSVYLVAVSSQGCRDTFQLVQKIVVTDEGEIEIPNAFTPNPNASPGSIFDPKDRSNDIFHPNVKGAETYQLSIFSRWGELIFDTKNTAEGWDGYYKGKICAPDVYVWKIHVTFKDGKVFNKAGDLILIR